jgi:hypothetical protein
MAGPDILYEDVEHRLTYHAPDELARDAHETVRALTMAWMKAVCDVLPAGREKSLFATEGQAALMWANAAIACNGGPKEHLVADDLAAIRSDFGVSYGDGASETGVYVEEGSRPL